MERIHPQGLTAGQHEALERLRSVPAPPSRELRMAVGRGLIGMAPVVALALLAALTWTREPAPVRAPGVALHTAAHAAITSAYATHRTHHAVEAHRFLTGEWPEALSEVSGDGLLRASVLAAPDASSYYYAQRDGGVLLLAPAR